MDLPSSYSDYVSLQSIRSDAQGISGENLQKIGVVVTMGARTKSRAEQSLQWDGISTKFGKLNRIKDDEQKSEAGV